MDSSKMDFFGSEYFSINKKMLKFMGLWPYQSWIVKIAIRAVFGVLMCLGVLPQIIAFCKHRNTDVDKLIQSTAIAFYIIGVGLKLVMQVLAEDKIQIVYENVVKNWELLDDDKERTTLTEHSQIGRFLTILYVSYMFLALIVFITLPCLTVVLDKFFPLNESRPLMFVLDGEFGVDKYANYHNIYLFESCTCIVSVIIFSTIDSTYAVCVQQCIGLMTVVKDRLKHSTKLALEIKSKDDENDAPYKGVVKSIILHKKVLNFARILESSYSASFLVIMGCNVAILSVGSVIILINMDNPMMMIRYCSIFIGLMIHMFYVSLPGQKLIDSSGGIFDDAYNSHWYECSRRTKNLLRFLMLHSKEPCQLTAGGIYVMNIANFGSLAKTSMSYITVFASFR